MARRLLDLGHEVTVWNRSPQKAQVLAAAGATAAGTPAELARACDTVISILSNAAAIEQAYAGAQGLLAGEIRGKLFIEMSTVRPQDQRALAERVRARGAAMIDCPVGGTIGPAREGKLFGFVGGEPTDVARARPVLDQLCRRVEHVGPVGAGASMKLAINLPLLVFWQSFAEALSLCQNLGLDPARVVDIFADTSGGPNVLKGRGPMIAKALRGQDTGAVTFDVDSICKDLRTMVEEAAALGRTLPVTARALECFDEAAAEGLGGGDATSLPVRWLKKGERKPA